MAGFSVDVTGDKQVAKTMKKGMKDDIRKRLQTLTLRIEAEVKMATVVDTGNLRASMTHGFPSPLSSRIGSAVEYAEFIEQGTDRMEARHMEGASKVLGEGMMSFALRKLAPAMKDFCVGIAKDAKKKGKGV